MLLSQLLLITLSALLHAGWNFYAKRAPQKLEIITLALIFATVLFFPRLFYEVSWPTATGWAIAFVTGFLQAVYVVMLYRAYESGGLTLVYPLSRGMGVLMTFCLETFFITHPWNWVEIFGISSVTVGTSCLAIPSLKGVQRRGVIYSLLIGVILGIVYVIGRFSTNHISSFAYLWGMFFGSIFFLVAALGKDFSSKLVWAFHSWKGVALVIGIGSFCSYWIAVSLFKTVPAATVVAVRELSVVFGALLGFVLLKEKITVLKVFAILAITVGAILLKFR